MIMNITSIFYFFMMEMEGNNDRPSLVEEKERSLFNTIDALVSEMWLEAPGCSMRTFLAAVKERFDDDSSIQQNDVFLKRRIKSAKAAIPYRRLENQEQDTNLSIDQATFVAKKLEIRQSLRTKRRYAEADRIAAGLEALGIQIDDELKTWRFVGRGMTDSCRTTTNINDSKAQDTNNNNSNNGTRCEMCGRYFASRNLVFKHLRDPSSGCGTAIFATDQSIENPPSVLKKDSRREDAIAKKKKKSSTRKTGKTMRHTAKECSLWFGDLPLVWSRHGGSYRRLRALLRAHLPRDCPQPWIKTVVRKAYRSARLQDEDTNHQRRAPSGEKYSMVDDAGEDDENKNKRKTADTVRLGVYLGYAIVVFRDKTEAAAVHKAMHGKQVSAESVWTAHERRQDNTDWIGLRDESPFILKVRTVLTDQGKEDVNTSSAPCANGMSHGQHPPLSDQLKPLSTEELVQRAQGLAKNLHVQDRLPDAVIENEGRLRQPGGRVMTPHDLALEQAIAGYKSKIPTAPAVGADVPHRRTVHGKGRPVPQQHCHQLHSLLQTTRWAVPNHREKVTAERYMVLQTKVTNDPFWGELRQACRELMDWADPGYYYSGIAVTKNFHSSPHIDDCDQTFQYAISLGDFDASTGGELCVEGYDEGGDFINVVNTYNRIVKVEGRHVHWVRPWSNKGDRYSLVFYDTSDRNVTPKLPLGIDPNFCNQL